MSHAPRTRPDRCGARLLAAALLGLAAACATTGRVPGPGTASVHDPAEEEELWILLPAPGPPGRPTPPPASGLFALRSDGSSRALVPSASDVRVAVEGRLAAVTLAQDFAPGEIAGARELELRLALPPGTALDQLVLSFGERRIRAVVQERERARELWALARGQGRRAVLVGETAPGVFVQRLALGEEEHALTARTGWAQPVRAEVGTVDLPLSLPLGGTAAGTPLELHATVDAGVPLAALEAPALAGFAPTIDGEGRAEAEWRGSAPAALALRWRVVASESWRAVAWSDAEAVHVAIYRPEHEAPQTLLRAEGIAPPRVLWEELGAREVATPAVTRGLGLASLARREAGAGGPLRIELSPPVSRTRWLETWPRPSRLRAAHRVLARAELEALERRAAALDPADPAERAELEALGEQALALALANGLVSPLTELVLVDASER